MSAFWVKLKPHIFSWHMIPCLAMIVIAAAAAIVTGQPSRVLGAVGCMLMMAAMGGHSHGRHSHQEHDK